MFNKIKKLAKKAKEALKHVIEKVEEYVMVKEEIELKKMELVVDTVKCAVKGTADTVKCAVKGTADTVKDDKNRLILGLVFLGLGGSLIASVYIHSPIN